MTNLNEILLQLIKNTFKDDKYKTNGICIQEFSSAGANYSSAIFKVIVKSISDEDDLRLFAKVASWPASLRREIDCDFAYEIEQYFYTEIMPSYEALQDKYNIAVEDRLVTAKLYAVNSNYLEETVVLEDLQAKGYLLYDRFKPIDWEFTANALEQIAKLHALSFAHKQEYPEMHAFIAKKYDWTKRTKYNLQVKEIFRNTAKSVIEVVPDDMKERLKAFINEQLSDEVFCKYYGPGKWAVFTHGDYRASNIMYKINQDGKITSMIPVDYQMLHFSSPCTDIFYLLYNGTDEEFRRKHLNELLDVYYNTLSRWLTAMNMDPKATFSRKDFDEDYKEMLPFGLLAATILLPFVLVDVDDVLEVKDETLELSSFTVKISQKFIDRYLPTLKAFVDLGIL